MIARMASVPREEDDGAWVADRFDQVQAAQPPDPFDPHWHQRYLTEVEPIAMRLLAAVGGRRSARRLLAPVAYTLRRRRNLFRAKFSLAAGDALGRPSEGVAAAVAGELAWTCALVLDDLIDGSPEREGHPAAHAVFGRLHAATSAIAALGVVLWYGARAPGIEPVPRLRMFAFGLRLLRACAWTQLPGRERHTLDDYSGYARDVNCSTHWSIMAPFVAAGEPGACALLRRWGDAISVNGKIRNDLHDYCGGSSESDTVFKDFYRGTVSFPVLLLLAAPLADHERQAVERHFRSGRRTDFRLDACLHLLWRTNALRRCVEAIQANGQAAHAAAQGLSTRCGGADTLVSMMETWNRHVIQVAENRVEAAWQRDRNRHQVGHP